jgi:pSer/pThr/pTyr-binding forkhead associated (FHA) protein
VSAPAPAFWGPRFIDPTIRGVTVGRPGAATIALEHPSVSPRHALLVQAVDGILVRDLGSRHGTFVGRRRVDRATLRPGDRVIFGAVEYRVIGSRLESSGAAAGLDLRSANLTVARGEVRFLNRLNLAIAAGQFVGVLGRSGSGKSTLL